LAARTNGKEPLELDPLDELKREFERRIREIRTELREGARGAPADEHVDYLRKDLGDLSLDLRQLLDDALEPGRDIIRERPFLALGLALGVGVLFGVLLGRKGKE
jgi:hypothetical protein